MKKHFASIALLSICFLSSILVAAQSNYYFTVSAAHGHYYTKDYDQALSTFDQAFQLSAPNDRDLLAAAQAAARVGEEKQALEYLERYFALQGNIYLDLEAITSLPAFEQLKEQGRWRRTLKVARENNARLEPSLNNPLRIALEELYEQDQKTRDMDLLDSLMAKHGFPSEPVSAMLKKMNAQDKQNLSRFQELVPPGTIPGISEVGEKANLSVWLIIQHSSTAVQRQYLEALKASAENGESDWGRVAGTIDRIMVETEGVQLYGTQFGMDRDGNGFVKPLKDPANVNAHRAKVGLIALEHDVKRHGIRLTRPATTEWNK